MATQMEKQVNQALDELEQVADEIRVKIHLGGMEAKDTWRKLEPKLEDAKQQATAATDASVHALKDLAKAFRDLRAKLS